jgi:hypothetical protein
MTEEERRKRLREWGKRGGKRRLETMTKAKRTALAYEAGIKGGAPRTIDREKVRKLRDQGLKHREIAAALGIGIASVGRILKEEDKR